MIMTCQYLSSLYVPYINMLVPATRCKSGNKPIFTLNNNQHIRKGGEFIWGESPFKNKEFKKFWVYVFTPEDLTLESWDQVMLHKIWSHR